MTLSARNEKAEFRFTANSRFSEESNPIPGMTPSRDRPGDSETGLRFALGKCSLGSMLVAVSGRGVCAISLGDNPAVVTRELQDRFPNALLVGGDTEFDRLVSTVVDFLEAPALGLDLPLDLRGTAFQQRVWQTLQTIPAGSRVSYTEIAHRIGAPKSVRAAAKACAANTLAVAIPCHRVVRTDGALSGYRWGIERKAELLRRESQA